MKPLNLSRPLVIMVVGMPGAGKSFFAKQFAETFGAPLVSYDRLRYELFTNPQFTSVEQEIIDRVAFYQLEELLKTGRTILYEGGCNSRTTRVKIEGLARKARFNTLTIWVQTDPATCQSRATKRNSNRADDKYSPSLSVEQFKKLSSQLSAPSREDMVVISGKHTYSTQARMVLKKLVATHSHSSSGEKADPPASPQAERPNPPNIARRSVTIK